MVAVDRGVEENLPGDGKFPPIPGQQGEGRGQVAPGAVADEGDVLGGEAEELGMVKDLPGHGIAVLQPAGEGGLGGQAVLHRGHPAAHVPGQIETDPVIGVDVLHHPAAAVEKQQQTVPLFLRGGIEAHQHLPIAVHHLVIPHLIEKPQDMRLF